MVKIKYFLLFILILIITTYFKIIKTNKNRDTNINCYNLKLAMVNKFAVGNSKKLISCLKLNAARKKNTRKYIRIYNKKFYCYYDTIDFINLEIVEDKNKDKIKNKNKLKLNLIYGWRGIIG